MSPKKRVAMELDPLFERLQPAEVFFTPDGKQLFLLLEPERFMDGLVTLKNAGFSHLSLVSCVDWLERGEFELVYHLLRWEDGKRVALKVRIDRENPVFQTVLHLWPTARFYERDIHEFFGVVFEGNADREPLFLEHWDDIPPMRKDFDPQPYSQKIFDEREYQHPFVPHIVQANPDRLPWEETIDEAKKGGETNGGK
ncbi:MAG TPA: NADH-quinone oxidoreductase subunit C [Thermotogota bacterium]|nr:NADH-quinone oxidoreductase subunit C [Thermotogota bacterium]HRW93442.1 NADH-quinone oxidoreductase subunit C [Thermotogota bacterium]